MRHYLSGSYPRVWSSIKGALCDICQPTFKSWVDRCFPVVFHVDYWPKPNQIKIQYFGQLRSVNNLWSYSHRNSPNQTPAKWDHLSRSIPRVWLAKEPHVTRSDYPTPIASSTATNPSWLSVENGFMSELTQSRDIWLVYDSTSHGPRKSTFFKVVKKHVYFLWKVHKKATIWPNWTFFETWKFKMRFKMRHVPNRWTNVKNMAHGQTAWRTRTHAHGKYTRATT